MPSPTNLTALVLPVSSIKAVWPDTEALISWEPPPVASRTISPFCPSVIETLEPCLITTELVLPAKPIVAVPFTEETLEVKSW